MSLKKNTHHEPDSLQSLRFTPTWNPNSGCQVTGLIELCFDIYRMNPLACEWLEVGSFIGESALLFGSFDFVKRLDCVDPMNKEDKIYKFKKRTIHLKDKIFLHSCYSKEYSKKVKDKSLDVVYIDGNHSYESVSEDLELWYDKIKRGGFLCGHDYSKSFTSVLYAVEHFVQRNKLKIDKTYCDSSYMIRVQQ